MASNTYQMSDEHRKFLRKHRGYLIDNLLVESVLFNMPPGIFDRNSEEQITKVAKTQQDKVVKFLDILPTRGAHAFEAFIAATYKVQDWLGEQLAQEAGVHLNAVSAATDEGPGMKQVHRKILRCYLCEFIEKLDVERTVEALKKSGILKQGNPDHAKEILEEQPRRKQVEKLMEKLPKLGPNAFGSFFNALKVIQPQFYLDLMKSIGEKFPDAQLDMKTGIQESDECNASDAVATSQEYSLTTPCSKLPKEVRDLIKKQLDEQNKVSGHDWRSLCKALELPEGREERIAEEDDSPTELVIDTWINCKGKHATLKKLLKALMKCEQGGLVCEIEQILGVELPDEPERCDLVDGMAGMDVEDRKEKNSVTKNKAIRIIKDIPPDLKPQFINRLNGLEEGVLSEIATKILEERCYVRDAADFLDKTGEHKTRILFRELRKAGQCELREWMRDKFPPGSTGPKKSDDELRAAKMNYGRRLEVTQELNAKGYWKKLASHEDVDMELIHITLLEQAQPSKDAAETVLSSWEVRSKSTVGTMYDLLVDCGFNSVADLL